MSSANQNDATNPNSGNSIWQNKRIRRLILYTAVLLVVFLAGLVQNLNDPLRTHTTVEPATFVNVVSCNPEGKH